MTFDPGRLQRLRDATAAHTEGGAVGGVATQSLEVVLTDDALRAQFEEGTPMRRPGEPEDIACAALYLASPASSWVTGKIFQIDGGTEAPSISVPVAPIEPAT